MADGVITLDRATARRWCHFVWGARMTLMAEQGCRETNGLPRSKAADESFQELTEIWNVLDGVS